MEYPGDDFDLEEVRRKRDVNYSGRDYEEYGDISNIGEFLYADDTGMPLRDIENQEFSNVGDFLYPNAAKMNKTSEEFKNAADYAIEPLKTDMFDENELLVKSSGIDNNHLKGTDSVSIQIFEVYFRV